MATAGVDDATGRIVIYLSWKEAADVRAALPASSFLRMMLDGIDLSSKELPAKAFTEPYATNEHCCLICGCLPCICNKPAARGD